MKKLPTSGTARFRRSPGLALAGPIALALAAAGCGAGHKTAAAPDAPTTEAAASEPEGAPTTTSDPATIAGIVDELGRHGMQVCDDKAQGTSGAVETESTYEQHWRFGTGDPSACDRLGRGQLTFSRFAETVGATDAISTYRADSSQVAAYRCGRMDVTLDVGTPAGLRAQAESVVADTPGCTPEFVR